MQLRRLQNVFCDFETVFVSVHLEYADDVPGQRFVCVRDVNRWSRFGFVVLAAQLVKIIWRERPDVVITTGAAPGLIAIGIAKAMLRARTMWIDSIANCERISGSGTLARHVADVWLTQWPHLSGPGKPGHWGAVL